MKVSKDAVGSIEVGCGVWLTAGSPPMTVESMTATRAVCIWFREDEVGPFRDTFLLKTLERIPDKTMRRRGWGLTLTW